MRVESGQEYWRGVLLGGGLTTIPRWTSTPVTGEAEYEAPIPDDLVASSGRLAESLGMPFRSVVLAAHARVLSALCGEPEVMTGYLDADGRDLPCRLTTAADTWRGVLLDVHRAETDLLAYWDFPVADLQRELNLTDPQFETAFDPAVPSVGEGHEGGNPVLPAQVVLRVGVVRVVGRHVLRLRYRTDVLDGKSAGRIAGYHLTALARITADPAAEHRRQSLLSADELRFQIDDLAGPVRKLPDRRVHELFEDRAQAHPDAVAAVHGDRRWTYAELNARANRLGRALLGYGLRREQVVAVVTERNLDWMAAVLAIFKAGGAYLPLEPHFPADRISKALSRAECTLVLTEHGSTSTLDEALATLPGVRTHVVADAYAGENEDGNLGIEVGPDQLAYLLFTSGSTGEPKGAMCEHAGMLNHMYAKIVDLDIGEGEVIPQTGPQCFDISVWQLLAALLVGGRTLIVEQDVILDVERLVDTIVDGRAGVLQVVPSYLDAVLSYLEQHPRRLPDLHAVCPTGDFLKKELVQRWFAAQPTITMVNTYGLTETSDDAVHEIMDGVPDADRIPLGVPIINTRVYIVDEHLSPVPLGAPGLIVFSGVCVGRGYVNDPERTRSMFRPDPHRPGERICTTGDYGRWMPDGVLDFLGRRDNQVKIRGFRVELGEVENALLRVPGVRDSAVVVADGADHGKHLVAFVTGPEPLNVDLVRDGLARLVPGYLVPSVLRWQEALPLTPNGKIDRTTLTALAGELDVVGEAAQGHEAPRTPTERRLAAAWSAVLGIPEGQIGRGDAFFDHGGTSLSAIRLVIALDRMVSLKDLTRHPVLAELGDLIDDRSARHAVAASHHPVGPSGLLSAGRPARRRPPDRPRVTTEGTSAMSFSSAASHLGVDLRFGRPPILRVDAAGRAADWATARRDALRAAVTEHGSVLVRGLGLRNAADVEAVVGRLSTDLVAEKEAFAPREAYSDHVYSATKWPQNQQMCMHHELSYRTEFPGLMFFACLVAPTGGGSTCVADAPTVLAALPTELVTRFEREGWMLTRSYNDEIGASLAQAFGTDDRRAIESYCAANEIEYNWPADGELRTRQRRSAVVRHPITGQRCWFNQIAFLNEWTLDPEVREFLVDTYGAEGLPFNTRYGNGDPISQDVVDLLNSVYEASTAREPWRPGDLLIVDNIRTAHSREPFSGPREVLVALSDSVRLADCSPELR